MCYGKIAITHKLIISPQKIPIFPSISTDYLDKKIDIEKTVSPDIYIRPGLDLRVDTAPLLHSFWENQTWFFIGTEYKLILVSFLSPKGLGRRHVK